MDGLASATALTALLLAAACTSDGGNDSVLSSSGVGDVGDADVDADGADADDAGSGDADAGDADAGPKFDVAVGEGDGDAGDDGTQDVCDKVDLLFVIDNSFSMAQEQSKLIANFPVFANEIQTQLAGVDSYHVAVVTTDNYGDTPNINEDRPTCRTLGASVTRSDSGTCAPYAEGKPYMTDMDDLGAKFSCAADVGTDGASTERVGGAIVEAMRPAINDAGGCNEGFLRDDALLVIVILTDENDASTQWGSPTDWATAVAAAKGDREENVVVLSLIWDDGNGNPNGCTSNGLPPLIPGDETYGEAIVQFTNYFTNGTVGSVCVSDYGPFFSSAISVIGSACDDFVPPG